MLKPRITLFWRGKSRRPAARPAERSEDGVHSLLACFLHLFYSLDQNRVNQKVSTSLRLLLFRICF